MAPHTRSAGESSATLEQQQQGQNDQDLVEDQEEDQHHPRREASDSHAGLNTLEIEEAGLIAQYEEAKRKVANKRRREELRAMEDELEGREPTRFVEVAGTTLLSRKRPLSSSILEDSSISKYIKLAPPLRFDGKSTEGLRSGAQANFISQLLITELGAKVTTTEVHVRTVSGQPIRTYGNHRFLTHKTDVRRVRRSYAYTYIAIDITEYNAILGFPWLEKVNPDVDWSTSTWKFRPRGERLAKDKRVTYVSAIELLTDPDVSQLRMLVVKPVIDTDGDRTQIASVTLAGIEAFGDETFTRHSIPIKEGETIPYGPLYPMSANELRVLREYIETALAGRTLWRPVAFFSRKMIPAERNYHTGDGEMLAIVEAFVVWRHYLESPTTSTIVLTDHEALKSFMETKVLNRRQMRWAEVLAAYDFVIQWRRGKDNLADGLSRRLDHMGPDEPLTENILVELLKKRILEEYEPHASIQGHKVGGKSVYSVVTPLPEEQGVTPGISEEQEALGRERRESLVTRLK
ncbi:hypothetical protein CLAIMM_15021 [Cladophialophora immunda]|nr:hypothetical protein CLAIMM_15021 [Cladophialophora immunda]